MTQHPSALSSETRGLQNASHSFTAWCIPIWHRVQKVCIHWFAVNLLFWDLIKSEQTLSTILFYDTSQFLWAEQLVFPHKPARGFLTASLMFYSLRSSAASHKDFSCGRMSCAAPRYACCLLTVFSVFFPETHTPRWSGCMRLTEMITRWESRTFPF